MGCQGKRVCGPEWFVCMAAPIKPVRIGICVFAFILGCIAFILGAETGTSGERRSGTGAIVLLVIVQFFVVIFAGLALYGRLALTPLPRYRLYGAIFGFGMSWFYVIIALITIVVGVKFNQDYLAFASPLASLFVMGLNITYYLLLTPTPKVFPENQANC